MIRVSKFRRPSGYWYVRYWLAGRPVDESARTTTESAAEAYRVRREIEINTGFEPIRHAASEQLIGLYLQRRAAVRRPAERVVRSRGRGPGVVRHFFVDFPAVRGAEHLPRRPDLQVDHVRDPTRRAYVPVSSMVEGPAGPRLAVVLGSVHLKRRTESSQVRSTAYALCRFSGLREGGQ